jgi:hypothetical protein
VVRKKLEPSSRNYAETHTRAKTILGVPAATSERENFHRDFHTSEENPRNISIAPITKSFIFRLRDEKSAVKTLWPVACREFLFLPEYKVQHGEIEQKFEIITFIAKGAFGKVYKVKKLCDSQIFALKVLEKSKVSASAVKPDLT